MIGLADWPHQSPTVETHDDAAGRWACVAMYGSPKTQHRIIVVTLPHRGAVATSEAGVIAATTVNDAMRFGMTMAAEIASAYAPDQTQYRATTREMLSKPIDESDWAPLRLRVDGQETPSQHRRVLYGAWAAVASLPDCFLAVAAAPAVTPNDLASKVDRH